MYGGFPGTAPQSETTPFHPRSPYAVAKMAPEGASILYGEQWIGREGGALVVGNDFTGKVRVVVAPGALTRRTLSTMAVRMYG